MRALNSLVLPPLSALYNAISGARTRLFQGGILRVQQLDGPVISVGNLTTGGTGKTPLVEWVVLELASQGRKPCILTRGYGRANPKTQVVVSDFKEVFASPEQAGDEAYLLAKKLRGLAMVISNSDRIAAGREAASRFAANTFVLDDGFQNLRVARDLDIVTIDATNPWGGGHLLPWGRMREPLSGLRRADCVVLTRVDLVEDTREIVLRLNSLAGTRPLFRSRMIANGFFSVRKTEVRSEPSLETPLAAFCGVGNPRAFFDELRNLGYELSLTKSFPDHHWYRQQDLNLLVQEAAKLGVRSLVTTAKDAVKLTSLRIAMPCYVLDIKMEIDEATQFSDLIRKACVRSGLA